MRATASVLVSLLLLAGCGDSGEDPEAPDAAQPGPVDAASIDAAPDPADASPTHDAVAVPPPDAVAVPPPDASTAIPINQHTDRYDPASDRMVVSHCLRDAVIAIDVESGAETVIVDEWPFEEGGSVCPLDLTRAADDSSFHAVVSHSYDRDEDSRCHTRKLVAISSEGEVTRVKKLYGDCSDDNGDSQTYHSPLLDDAHDRLIFLEDDCEPSSCDSNILGIAHATGAQTLDYTIFDGRDDDDSPTQRGKALVFDPRAPDRRVLALISQANTVDVIDVDSETREVLLTVQTNWGGRVVTPRELTLDVAGQRLFVTGTIPGGRAVIRIDLASGDQALLYDGTANAQGDRITCAPQVAFDSKRDRLLLFVSAGPQCTEGLYAIDAGDGTLTRLPYTPSPAAAPARPQP